ncbi:hypothetical protein RYX36_011607 [Vicia faba]
MAPTPTNPEEHEPVRLKSLAETQNSKTALKYPKRPPQLQGISELVNSLNILSAPDFYVVLDVEPTANSNTIRNQYNKLSSLFYPDNNRASSREAFKLVTDAFGDLSDKTLRQNYDGKVDLEIRENMRTFWTACCTCRVLHQFERRYLGHKLVCPGCNSSFKAVEVVENDGSGEEEDNTLGEFMLKSIKRNKKWENRF